LSMKIFFDVGAELGLDSLPFARNNPDSVVYAFEPNPHMVKHLTEQSQGLDNYFIIPFAVSDYHGFSNFNICTEHPGICSLLEFDDSGVQNWNGYGIGTDFPIHTDEKVEVEVIRLDHFIKENEITKIDYFHCDTQGSDLNVLKGMGDYIHLINQGQVEAEFQQKSFYQNQNNYKETMSFLIENGFEIVKINPEGGLRECNIIFKKCPLSFSI
jgi:FkbM family methyltransferase